MAQVFDDAAEVSPNPAETALSEVAAQRSRRVRSASQSGLLLFWDSNGPVAPLMTPTRRIALAVKRGMDIFLALVGLAVLSPLLIFVALLVKATSPGPVLFRQERVGLNGKRFSLLKFRTLYVDREDRSGIAQITSGDDRVTSIGRILRKTSIDELPQLLNIIAGDMSVVGPRPHVPQMVAAGAEYGDLVPYYGMRWLMKPGLTGWAQANGLRGPTVSPLKARARVNHDIAYIQNFSIWLDIQTIWRTARTEFLGGTGV